MPRRDPFRCHRFSRDVNLLAVRWYCRYPRSYRDVRDLLAERGIAVDAATVYRWVRKFGCEIRQRAYGRHRNWRGLTWHVDETYLRRLSQAEARGSELEVEADLAVRKSATVAAGCDFREADLGLAPLVLLSDP